MDPVQTAFDIFTNVVGSSPQQIIAFATSNENLRAVQQLTDQYLAAVKHQLGLS